MTPINYDALMERFDPEDQGKIEISLQRPDIEGLVLSKAGRLYTVLAFGPASVYKTVQDAWNHAVKPVGYYIKGTFSSTTQEAVMWLRANPGVSMREAARKFNVNASAISRAMRTPRCACCGQPLRNRPASEQVIP